MTALTAAEWHAGQVRRLRSQFCFTESIAVSFFMPRGHCTSASSPSAMQSSQIVGLCEPKDAPAWWKEPCVLGESMFPPTT
jgi:hypothetical protein